MKNVGKFICLGPPLRAPQSGGHSEHREKNQGYEGKTRKLSAGALRTVVTLSWCWTVNGGASRRLEVFGRPWCCSLLAFSGLFCDQLTRPRYLRVLEFFAARRRRRSRRDSRPMWSWTPKRKEPQFRGSLNHRLFKFYLFFDANHCQPLCFWQHSSIQQHLHYIVDETFGIWVSGFFNFEQFWWLF